MYHVIHQWVGQISTGRNEFPTYRRSVPWSSRAFKRMTHFHRTTKAFYVMIYLVFTTIMCPMSLICTNN